MDIRAPDVLYPAAIAELNLSKSSRYIYLSIPAIYFLCSQTGKHFAKCMRSSRDLTTVESLNNAAVLRICVDDNLRYDRDGNINIFPCLTVEDLTIPNSSIHMHNQ